MPVRIGALLPTSRMFPRVDQHFVMGLKAALKNAAVPYELYVEPIGNAAVKDAVIEKVQRLLLQHEPHVVTGIIGSGLAPHIHGFFRDAGKPLIVNNLGAEPLLLGGERNPFVFHNSINIWQSLYALGYWAAQNRGKRACVAAALHEAGYDMLRAFWQGFACGGGEILATEVTHRDSAIADPTPQLQNLLQQQPDFIAAFYSGREGIAFMQAYTALRLKNAMPLVTSPMMMHMNWLPQMGDAAAHIPTAFSWDTGALPEEYQLFRSSCNVRPNDEPAVFALLGYETGRILATAVADNVDCWQDGEAMRRAIAGIEFVSPRGPLRIDQDHGVVETTDLLQELQHDESGGLQRVTIRRLPLPGGFRADLQNYKQQIARSGWINPYLVN